MPVGRAALIASLLAVSGCAAAGGSVSSRLVTPGEPTASLDDTGLPPGPPVLQAHMRKVGALQSTATAKNSLLPTIESTNPVLSAALLGLTLSETAANHRAAASAYRTIGILDHAYKHYQRAVVLEPCDAASYDGMARIWRQWGMPALALSEAYHAVSCNRKSAEIFNTLGTIFEALGQPENAQRAYRQAVTLEPRAAYALNNLCYLEMTANRPAAAAAFCERALAIAPSQVAARNNLALLQARGGDLSGAEARLRTGAPAGTSIYNVGVLRLSEGRFGEAADLFDEAADVQPSLILARRRSIQARKAARAAERR